MALRGARRAALPARPPRSAPLPPICPLRVSVLAPVEECRAAKPGGAEGTTVWSTPSRTWRRTGCSCSPWTTRNSRTRRRCASWYLARRVQDLGVLLLVATRPAAQAGSNVVLDELRREAGADIVRLTPLSVQAVGHLVQDALGEMPDTAFATACTRATGGNPFYLEELLRDAAVRGVVPTSGNADVVGRSGPPSIVRGLLLRMGTLPSGALPLARACAVFGAGHRLADCAELADLSLDDAATAADALAAAGFLAPSLTLEFRHPILEAAVLSDLGAHEERRWHSRAADLLAASGADARHVAAHLLRRDPAGDAATVAILRAAAAAAIRSGAPVGAAAYLRRALAEPPPGADLADVLYHLGAAEAALGDAAAGEHLAAGMRQPPTR